MQTFRRSLLSMLFLFAATRPVGASPRNPELRGVRSFALALGVSLDEPNLALLGQYDLVVLDGEAASTEQIQALKTKGSVVLGYLSVGTIERGRSWYSKVKPYRLEFWDDWGEWYADVSSARYRKIILNVGKTLAGKGFDGLFLDNVDMVEVHREKRGAMKRLVAAFAEYLHGQSKLLFSQNGEKFTIRIAANLDGWNREGVTSDYNFDTRKYRATSKRFLARRLAALNQIAALGPLVAITNYVAPMDIATQQSSCVWGCSHAFPSYTTDIELSVVPPLCRCE